MKSKTVSESSAYPRYAFATQPLRLRRQSTEFNLSDDSNADDLKSVNKIESAKRVRREIETLEPCEYTIYLPPEEDNESLPTYEQMKPFQSNEASNPAQKVSFQPHLFKTCHSIENCNHIPHTQYSQLAKRPANNHISTVASNSHPFPCSKLNSYLPLSQRFSFPPVPCSKSSCMRHYPLVPTEQTIEPPIEAPETSPLPTTAVDSIVTATTPPPCVTTTSSPKVPPCEMCQNQSRSESGGVIIKKAIILFNSADQNSTNLSSIVDAFRNFNDDDTDFEDLQENDDVQILDGQELIDKEKRFTNLFDHDSSSARKSSAIGFKLLDLLEKVHNDLQTANHINSQYNDDDEFSSNDDPVKHDISDSNEPVAKKCATGKDLIEACKSLSKVLSSSYDQQRSIENLQ